MENRKHLPKDLDHGNGIGFEDEGDQGHGHDEDIQQVEGIPAEGALVKDEAEDDDFESDLDSEDGREEVVEVIEHGVSAGVGLEGIFCGQHGGGYEDTNEDTIGEIAVVDDLVTEHSKGVGVAEDEQGRRLRDGFGRRGSWQFAHPPRPGRDQLLLAGLFVSSRLLVLPFSLIFEFFLILVQFLLVFFLLGLSHRLGVGQIIDGDSQEDIE